MEKEVTSNGSLHRLLTVEQVSELLGVTRDWIYDHVERQKFPSVKLGRHLRFREQDIADYIEANFRPPIDFPEEVEVVPLPEKAVKARKA